MVFFFNFQSKLILQIVFFSYSCYYYLWCHLLTSLICLRLPGFLGCLFIWCKHLFECWCDERTFTLWCGYITNKVLLIFYIELFMLINWIQNVFNNVVVDFTCNLPMSRILVIWIKDLARFFLSGGLFKIACHFPKQVSPWWLVELVFVVLYWIFFCLCSWTCAKLYHVCVSIGMQVLFVPACWIGVVVKESANHTWYTRIFVIVFFVLINIEKFGVDGTKKKSIILL